jgi:biopolymer transport protein ExbD
MRFKTGRGDRVELNLTPLIDVVFILLMFFIVTTTFDRYAQLKIELPEASVEPQSAQAPPLELAIDAAGSYYLNGQPLVNTQAATLMSALERAAEGRLDTPLVISADRRAQHQAVVTALDAAARVGLTRLSIPTVQAEAAP